jgi:hypothetical protein
MLVKQVLTKQALYHLSHIYSPFCSGCFGDGVANDLPVLALNVGPPDLGFPSS